MSNHVSYLDIVALATTGPMTFVSKADVRKWPVFGLLARCAGTIFVQRERKLDVEWVNERIASLAQRGALICLFPEGTSSNGRHVLPFRSSLLEPAINKPVCPVWIRYETDEGSVGRDVAYWGDAVFALQFQPENGAKWPRSALNTPLPTACSQAVSPWIYDDMNTMRVLKDGCEVERPVEKVLHSERTLYGGCPERRTIHIPRLEPGESLIFRGKVVFIRTLTIPG